MNQGKNHKAWQAAINLRTALSEMARIIAGSTNSSTYTEFATSVPSKTDTETFGNRFSQPHAYSNPVTFSRCLGRRKLTDCISEIFSATGGYCALPNDVG